MVNLFNTRSVDQDIDFRRISAEAEVKRLTEIGDVAAVTHQLYEKYRIGTSTKLRRADAEMKHEVISNGVLVTIQIPVDGSLDLFPLRMSASSARRPSGFRNVEVIDANYWTGPGVPYSHLALRETFSSPTTDEVRNWGGELTDRIVDELAQVKDAAAAANELLKTYIETAVLARKATFEASGGLEDFGTGI